MNRQTADEVVACLAGERTLYHYYHSADSGRLLKKHHGQPAATLAIHGPAAQVLFCTNVGGTGISVPGQVGKQSSTATGGFVVLSIGLISDPAILLIDTPQGACSGNLRPAQTDR